jgi:hypothetical protein
MSLGIIPENTISLGFEGAKKSPFRFLGKGISFFS